MTAFLIANMAPIMFGGMIFFMLIGYPAAFSLAATGLFFGFVGIELGILPASLMQALTPDESDAWMDGTQPHRTPSLAEAVRACKGPLVLVSHQLDPEGLPPRKDLDAFIDTLGSLNQQAAVACERVTLVTASAALVLKEPA